MTIKVWISTRSNGGKPEFVQLWTRKPKYDSMYDSMHHPGGYTNVCRQALLQLLRGTGKRIPRKTINLLELEITAK